MLLGRALGALQLVAGIALDQLDPVSLLLALGHGQAHLAAAALREPVLDQLLLGQGVLEQQLGRNLHRIHLAVVLFDHPLQDQTQAGAIGGGLLEGFLCGLPGGHLDGLLDGLPGGFGRGGLNGIGGEAEPAH